MPFPDLVIRGHRVIRDNSDGPASVHISRGRIERVGAYDDVPQGCEVVEADESHVVMPGLVDTHVHINEPGRAHWEGFETATRAAAAGGVTTLVEMPLNSIPPTTTIEGFHEKLAAAEEKCLVDVGFWGGVVPGNVGELSRLFDAGVLGFKCFLVHSGVDEFPNVTEADLRLAMKELARLDAVLIVHAELPGPIAEALDEIVAQERQDPRAYHTFLRSRPREAEDRAVELVIRLSRETGARAHIVHHSSSDSLAALRKAREEGVNITLETCPHYLCFAAEEIADGATLFKCCPPIRERENSEKLWAALSDRLIEMIVSDHSPAPPDLKCMDSGDFMQAWGGISSLQLRLPAVWTHARERGHSIHDLVRWMSKEPARLVRLDHRKGALKAGYDADIMIWNADETFRVEPQRLQHRHKLTPYAGLTLHGVVKKTFLRGHMIYDDGKFAPTPEGKMLLRGEL